MRLQRRLISILRDWPLVQTVRSRDRAFSQNSFPRHGSIARRARDFFSVPEMHRPSISRPPKRAYAKTVREGQVVVGRNERLAAKFFLAHTRGPRCLARRHPLTQTSTCECDPR